MKSVKFSYLRICDGVRTWKANVSWMESLKFEIEVSSASLYVEKKSVILWLDGSEGRKVCGLAEEKMLLMHNGRSAIFQCKAKLI